MTPWMDHFDYVSLRELSHADFIFKVGTIVDLGLAHAGLQDVPDEVGGPKVIDVLKQELAVSVQAAANKDRFWMADASTKRQNVQEHVEMWGQFISIRSRRRNDPSLLLNTGFDPKKKIVKVSAAGRGGTRVPEGVKATHGTTSGTIIVQCKRMGRQGSFEARYSTDPNNEAAWVDGGHHVSSRQMPMGGLVPGTKYYFSIRFHGANGTSAWSEPISIICL